MGISFEKISGPLSERSLVTRGLSSIETEILLGAREGKPFTIPAGTTLGVALQELTQRLLYNHVLISDGTSETQCQITGFARRLVTATDKDGNTRRFYFSEPDEGKEARDITITPLRT